VYALLLHPMAKHTLYKEVKSQNVDAVINVQLKKEELAKENKKLKTI